jgi:type II secretory pathway pseudopilin PulG
MGKHTQTGFTIIEIMLFLAVTGLLAIGILVGSGVSIGQQRYRDSVNSLKSFIQDQYSEVTNVDNSRSGGWTCDTGGAVTEVSSGQPRGTSDCVLIGRIITVDATGTKLTSSNVVAYRTPGAAVLPGDIAEIATNYRMSISPIDQVNQDVSWGAQIVQKKTTTPLSLSVLIIRSPLSGSLFTFTVDGATTNPSGMVATANTSQPRDLCVNADIGSFVGRRMEVRIDAYATNQGGVLIPPESESVCD